jgi:hypothetical protein
LDSLNTVQILIRLEIVIGFDPRFRRNLQEREFVITIDDIAYHCFNINNFKRLEIVRLVLIHETHTDKYEQCKSDWIAIELLQ